VDEIMIHSESTGDMQDLHGDMQDLHTCYGLTAKFMLGNPKFSPNLKYMSATNE
jgi:hypothetical protein